MTERCADLDEFFDGELVADHADAFRHHLPTCERCQRVLHGRMQESVVARAPSGHREQAVPGAPARVEASACVGSDTSAPAMGRTAAPGQPARRWRLHRAVAYAAPLLAAAAAIPIWLAHRSESGFQMALAIERAPVTERGAGTAVPRRGMSAHTGDVLRPEVRGERHQAIWVYLDEHELILRCPEEDRCHGADGELAVELPLTARGTYAVVAAGSSAAIPAPEATLDRTLAAARIAGVHTQVQYVDVD